MHKKQVDSSIYTFKKYIDKKRWISIWHQIDEVLSINPSTVLELGPGPGIFKTLAVHFGITVDTVDIDPELNPDYLASAEDLPFADATYDCVCAFQLLEHMPYEDSLIAFREIVRVAKKNILISLPDVGKLWEYSVYIPIFGKKNFTIRRPFQRPKIHQFDGEHYWEINKKDYLLNKVIKDFLNKKIEVRNTYRVEGNPYHRFFIFNKR